MASAIDITGTSADEHLVGTDLHDYISGQGGNDYIQGLAGSDSLFGRDGNDKLEGGPGYDKLSGGKGNDELLGGPGNDILTGGLGADIFDCGLGDDTVTDFAPWEGDKVESNCETVIQQNFVGDGGFESGNIVIDASEPRGYWGSTGDRFSGNVLVTNEDAHSGTHSLKIISDLDQAAYVYQFVQTGTYDYTFSFWYKGKSGDTVGEVLTGWGPPPWFLGGPFNPKFGSIISPTNATDSIFPLDGQWHHAAVVNTIDVKAYYLDENLVACGQGDTVKPAVSIMGDTSQSNYSGVFYIDDVSLVRGQQFDTSNCS